MATVQCANYERDVDTRLLACPDSGTPVGYQGSTSIDYDQVRTVERAVREQGILAEAVREAAALSRLHPFLQSLHGSLAISSLHLRVLLHMPMSLRFSGGQ